MLFRSGYFLFVRGDRAVPITGAAGTTILRMKGNILTGNQTFPVSGLKYEAVGNPFPSRIDFRTVTKSNIANSFIAWNPNSAGLYNVGAYETYAFNGTDYVKAGGAVRNFIESGEAFYIQSNSASAGSLLVKESDKGANSSLQSRNNREWPTLEVTLMAANTAGGYYVADGVMVNFDHSYSEGFDNDDVRKFLNTFDNVSIPLAGYNLFAERRPPLSPTDTIPLSINSLRQGNYQFEISGTSIRTNGLVGYLKDAYLGSETRLQLHRSNLITFNINQDPASYAVNRFVLLFRPTGGASPQNIGITAVRANKANTVQWNTGDESTIEHYNVQYSDDGSKFNDIARLLPLGTAVKTQKYKFLHEGASSPNMYYRVTATDMKGSTHESSIVKIALETDNAGITVFPNPVTNGLINIYFNTQRMGLYTIQVLDSRGVVVHIENYNLKADNVQKKMTVSGLTPGIYSILLVDATGNKTVKTIVSQ